MSCTGGTIRTNWVERWITNNLEVYVPANRFVTEFHTNVVVRTRTNVVDVCTTNLVTRHVTNTLQVSLFRTNFIQAYQTNYRNLNVTNWSTVLVLRTNWVQQNLTNVAVVEVPRPDQNTDAHKAGTPAAAKSAPGSNSLII